MSSICATQGALTYSATVDEAGLMARRFPGKSVGHLQPDLAYSNLVSSMRRGHVTLLSLGDDLVLLQPLVRPPGLLARCA